MKKRSYSGLVDDLRAANVEAKYHLESADNLRKDNDELRKRVAALDKESGEFANHCNLCYRIIGQLLNKLEGK